MSFIGQHAVIPYPQCGLVLKFVLALVFGGLGSILLVLELIVLVLVLYCHLFLVVVFYIGFLAFCGMLSTQFYTPGVE